MCIGVQFVAFLCIMFRSTSAQSISVFCVSWTNLLCTTRLHKPFGAVRRVLDPRSRGIHRCQPLVQFGWIQAPHAPPKRCTLYHNGSMHNGVFEGHFSTLLAGPRPLHFRAVLCIASSKVPVRTPPCRCTLRLVLTKAIQKPGPPSLLLRTPALCGQTMWTIPSLKAKPVCPPGSTNQHTHWACMQGFIGGVPLQGAQPMPSHCPPDAKCRLQWHL